MREKLIKLLRDMPYWICGVDEMADYLIENGVKVGDGTPSKWIPVTERLPEEDDGVVLVYSGDVEPAVFTGSIFLEYDKYEGWEINNVTHWMPLPEAPKED